jgi:hypothetical protein
VVVVVVVVVVIAVVVVKQKRWPNANNPFTTRTFYYVNTSKQHNEFNNDLIMKY